MKNILHTSFFVLCFLLSGCGIGDSALSSHAAAQQQAAATTGTLVPPSGGTSPTQPSSAASACPAQTFDTFLTAFANDVAIQKAFVTQPLQSETVDASAEPEPRPITKMLGLAELHFPLMPNLKQQARDGLQLEKTHSGNGKMEVKLVKPDTDYQVLFFFRNDGCWKLYRMRDDSL